MLFAKTLKPGKEVVLSEEDGGEILHLSQVCMSKPVDGARTYLKIKHGDGSYAACVLQKDKVESCSIDVFLSTAESVTLCVEGGKNELTVVGYFEPEEEGHHDFEDDMSDDEEGVSDEASDQEDQEVDLDAMTAPVLKKGKVEDLDAKDAKASKKALTAKASTSALSDSEDEENENEQDEDEEDSEDEEQDEGSDDQEESDEQSPKDSDAVGSEDEQSEEEEVPVAPVGKKRKPEQTRPNQPQGKKTKMANGTAASGKGDALGGYKTALVDYLKKHGKTPLATLGQKVKKPPTVDMKMATLLKSMSDTFAVDGGFCSLK